MVIRGNVTGFTGYLPTSPDGLYPENTGVVSMLTDNNYQRANVQGLKKYGKISTKTVTRVDNSNTSYVKKEGKIVVPRKSFKDLTKSK